MLRTKKMNDPKNGGGGGDELGQSEGGRTFSKNWHSVRENTRNNLFGSRWSELYVQYKLVRNIKRGRHLIMSIFSDAP